MNVKALTNIWRVDPKETSLWCHPFEHGFCVLKLPLPLSGMINMDHTFYKRKKLQLYTHCNDSKQQKKILLLLLDIRSVYPCQSKETHFFPRYTSVALITMIICCLSYVNYHDHLLSFLKLAFLAVPSIIWKMFFIVISKTFVLDHNNGISCRYQS